MTLHTTLKATKKQPGRTKTLGTRLAVGRWRKMSFKPVVMGKGKKIRAGRKRHVRFDGTAIEDLIKANTHRTRADKDVKAFRRLVKEVCQDVGKGLHIKKLALDVMHAASEAYLIELFRVAKLCASCDSRSTVVPDDFDSAKISLRIFLWPGREAKLVDLSTWEGEGEH